MRLAPRSGPEHMTLRLVRYWFGFEPPVSGEQYFRHGLGLMALKYGVDALLVGVATHTLWTPFDYFTSAPLQLSARLADASPFVAPALALWTLPFLWIGVSLTMRRLVDAGWSSWWSLFFFIPLASYLLMGLLIFLPSGEPAVVLERPSPEGRRLPSSLFAMLWGTAIGIVMMALGLLLLESYGLAVFMGMPFVIGLATAYLFRRRYPATAVETTQVVTMTAMLVAGVAFAIGFEGGICLLMVAPIGLGLAVMGGAMGRRLATWGEAPLPGAALVVLLWPGAAAYEANTSDAPAAARREVVSSIEIDAPADVVWRHVIAFSPIPEPDALLFRAGVAYPKSAEIVGSGVGAIRYCRFSTGDFVEPITQWEPGKLLSFDVTSSPPPMRELTPWSIQPPHLDGYLLPRAGEFRLVDLGGRTRLEGSTWYEQRLRPEGYWVVFSDYIISRIHARVLRHIKGEAERPAATVSSRRS